MTQNLGNKSVFLGCIEDGDPDCRNDDSDPDDAVGIDLFFEPDPGTESGDRRERRKTDRCSDSSITR